MVMIRAGASGLMLTSPVSRPTSKPPAVKSRNFWLEMVLMGEVYTARVQCAAARARAYSATAVLPALVWAATKTDAPCTAPAACVRAAPCRPGLVCGRKLSAGQGAGQGKVCGRAWGTHPRILAAAAAHAHPNHLRCTAVPMS